MDMFSVWRNEIEVELVERQADLNVAIEEHSAATIVAREAIEMRERLSERIEKAHGRGPLAVAFARRFNFMETPENEKAANALRARNRIKLLREQIADLRLALQQLDVIDQAAPADETTQELEVT